MRKFIFFAVIAVFFLSGCSSSQEISALNSGRTDIEQIQEKFRESILANYVEVKKENFEIAEAVSPTDSDYKEVAESPELKSWRAGINESWKAIQGDQRDRMCEYFYQGMIDDSSEFAYIFATAKQQFKREGTVIYSINNIRLREDNRKTIQFPTEQYSSALFICSSRIVLKLTNGDYSQPLDSKLTLLYYLADGKIQATFNFKLNS